MRFEVLRLTDVYYEARRAEKQCYFYTKRFIYKCERLIPVHVALHISLIELHDFEVHDKRTFFVLNICQLTNTLYMYVAKGKQKI